MNEFTLGAAESRFADIIRKIKPLTSSELSKLSEQEIGWKKTTSFTVLKRLCDLLTQKIPLTNMSGGSVLYRSLF